MKRLLLLFVALALGIFLGAFYANYVNSGRLSIINHGSNKLNYLLQIIDNSYVDTVSINDLVEKSLPEILSQLDPHSAYIPAQDAQEANDELRGSFSGIGVSFRIQHDTVVIMSVIKGGPSEKVGLMAGDRIVRIDSMLYVGQDVVTDTGAIHRLKGIKGTQVRLGVRRRGERDELTFNITRGDIPVESIDCAYMIHDTSIGYIHVKNFGETTYPEMLTALATFSMRGLGGLIIDLRGNRGGYMETAIRMVNEFLPEERLIVYTEGRKTQREDYWSDGHGSFENLPLVVLIDEMSASASEIFAGAMQDNDRALVIGRRSFGKGLVQQPMEFRDGSQVRLTVARYYTPSGRCIQKPYTGGHGEEYENDLMERYERGEFYSQDSIHQSGPEYKTAGGRAVYGGGGIMPDVFVPEDTTLVTSYYKEALYRGLLPQFAFHYSDTRRDILRHCHTADDVLKVINRDNVMNRFANFAAERGLRRRDLMMQHSMPLFERYLYGAIIYDVLDANAYQQYLNRFDNTVKRAISELCSED
ncbi:MAG: S41 family peptidase [Bacteroidaceae bacterium]|nr:S41 family peptidase [Bacteroidaceae bacterium]